MKILTELTSEKTLFTLVNLLLALQRGQRRLVIFVLGLAVLLSATTSKLSAQDLGGGTVDYFSSGVLMPVGTVVVVNFEDDFVFSLNTEAEKNRPVDIELQNLIDTYFDFLPNVPTGEVSPKTLRVTVEDETSGSVGATVTAYNPVNQVYTISGRRQINYNNGTISQLVFSAQVNRMAFSDEMEVSSSNLANFRVSYNDATSNIRLTARDFLKLLETPPIVPADNGAISTFPGESEASTNVPVPETELTDERKRQLMLQYINYLLTHWF